MKFEPVKSPWFEPDVRWKYYGGVTELDDYLKTFVIKGNFHSKVPEDVLKSYETVEYLMAHSFYHWPMYDEALSNLIKILEMAVRFRAKELGISLKHQMPNGNETPKGMKVLVDQVIKVVPKSDSFKKAMERATKIRNIDSHRTHHSYSGGLLKRDVAISYINLINILFLDHTIEDLSKQTLENLPHDFKDFTDSCSAIREGENSSFYCIYDFKLIEAYQVGDQCLYLIEYHPILKGMVKGISEDRHPKPIFVTVTDITEYTEGYRMTRLDGSKFSVVKPDSLAMESDYKRFKAELALLDSKKRLFYQMTVDSERGLALIKHRYKNYWKSFSN